MVSFNFRVKKRLSEYINRIVSSLPEAMSFSCRITCKLDLGFTFS